MPSYQLGQSYGQVAAKPKNTAIGPNTPGAPPSAVDPTISRISALNRHKTDAGNAYDTQADSMWNDLYGKQQASLPGQLQNVNAQTARDTRLAAERGRGSALGGSTAMGFGKAALGGQQAELKARQDNARKSLEIRMTQINQQIQQATLAEDTELATKLANAMAAAQLLAAQIENGSGMDPAVAQDLIDQQMGK